MHARRLRRRSAAGRRWRPRAALFGGWQPAAKRVQVYAIPHRSHAERLCRCRAHPDRRRGQVWRPSEDADTLFHSFTQAAADRSGLGLGLSIARRSVEANHGFLKVRDVPGSGCVFTIDLPRRELPRPRLVVNAN
ncbi:MAG TPA: ATP-binding protein [Casimicrobiaceae bacterium]